MKKLVILLLCCAVLISACAVNAHIAHVKQTESYMETYFTDKDSYVKIAEILCRHYEENSLEGDVSVWAGGELFYHKYVPMENTTSAYTYTSYDPDPVSPLTESELDFIGNFLDGSWFEYVLIDGEFVEFGSSSGARFLYYSVTGKKPEKFESFYTMNNFGDGWYFSQNNAR